MRYITLSVAILSVSLRRALAFRANLVAESLVSVVNVATSLAILGSIHAVAGSLGGWSRGETSLVLGTYLIASGLLWAWVDPNLGWFRDQVTQGQLDDLLLRPASSVFLASLGTCSPLAFTQSMAGIVVLAIGIAQRGGGSSPIDAVYASAIFLAGCIAIWAIRLLMASVAFWAPSVQPDVGFKAAWEFGRYPVSIYRRPVRLALTWVLPLGMVATLPVRALAGDLGTGTALVVLTVCVAIVLIALRTWHAGLRRYTSATS